MTVPFDRRNLITGEPAFPVLFKDDYFNLEIKCQGEFGYSYKTNQGEFIASAGLENSFLQAWDEAIELTPIGWVAITQAREWEPKDCDPGTEPDSPVYDGPFDPYAGNLDAIAEDTGWGSDYDYLHYIG